MINSYIIYIRKNDMLSIKTQEQKSSLNFVRKVFKDGEIIYNNLHQENKEILTYGNIIQICSLCNHFKENRKYYKNNRSKKEFIKYEKSLSVLDNLVKTKFNYEILGYDTENTIVKLDEKTSERKYFDLVKKWFYDENSDFSELEYLLDVYIPMEIENYELEVLLNILGYYYDFGNRSKDTDMYKSLDKRFQVLETRI